MMRAWFVAVLACVVVGTLSIAQVTPEPLRTADYYAIFERLWTGQINDAGDFVPKVGRLPSPEFSARLGSGQPRHIPNYGLKPYNYARAIGSIGFPSLGEFEHRSGRLIRGSGYHGLRRDGRAGGGLGNPSIEYTVFVPELGSRVIEVPADLQVLALPSAYNASWRHELPTPLNPTPEQWQQQWKALRDQFGNADPDPDRPVHPQGPPCGFELVIARDADRNPSARVMRLIGEVAWIGILSAEGEFLPDPALPPLPGPATLPARFTEAEAKLYYNVPVTSPRTESTVYTLTDTEPVYEFRSGRLIEGELHKSGTFVPTAGSLVTDFRAYKVDWQSPRIYNLPGVLRKIEVPVGPK